MQLSNNAVIEWRDGQPYASTFDDVYFSSDNGLLEAEYVFLQGNDLAERWKRLNTQESQIEDVHGEPPSSITLRLAQGERKRNLPSFTITETGFGTGLNFLCAARLWLSTAPKDATLHFISIEKYPLSLSDLSSALQLWPELKELSEPLLANYENIFNGEKTLSLYDNRVHLTLHIGDAMMCLTTLVNSNETLIDAWFLDGFSPSKNPDMWQAELFKKMALLSNSDTSFATFTSAGAVRRDLMKAGFEVSKRPGFGKKREMLVGHFLANTNDS
jgi:tRNA 5-methylaminomethyl-2-thiouridine biosynthesis bifunctional protein